MCLRNPQQQFGADFAGWRLCGKRFGKSTGSWTGDAGLPCDATDLPRAVGEVNPVDAHRNSLMLTGIPEWRPH